VSYELDAHADGADEVAAGLEALPGELTQDLFKVLDDSAARLQRDWRANARRTARRHGKHYPSSITHDVYQGEGAIWADTGPDSAKLQGGMGRGFEYGGSNSPPHYDGAIALAANEPRFTEAVLEHIGYVIGDA
jgi:hypothetical protein